MANNKVQLADGTVLLDLSDTTAVAADVQNGKYFYTADGIKTLGTATGGTGAISVVDTTDSHGGTVRTITAIDISDTTAVASDVAQGKYFYTADGQKTAGTANGGSTLSGTWETVWNDDVVFEYDSTENYPYCEISALNNVAIESGSVWRITYDNTEYICTATTSGNFITIGNPKWGGGVDDESNVPFVFYKTQNNIWAGEVNGQNVHSTYHFKIERRISDSSDSSSTLITKTITANGTYSAQTDNADGYSSVTVNVPTGITPVGTLNITTNDTYDVTNYASAIVNVPTGSSTPSATQHTIYFEFTDDTNTTITAYYDSTFISDAITATTPTTYGGKTVDLAQLDNVTWYERSTGTWETIFENASVGYYPESDTTQYPYCWIQ